ncbi:TspO/MBR family protein [Anaerosporobacter faecicola]|uniref:TspO/MBR family protein n=1 Tax=Anaerosporobacter faecicola TaxID=2718714 RepID=UPI00143AADA4|nr:TspO/MBR family protein [Anaerosporobacter faecicola]
MKIRWKPLLISLAIPQIVGAVTGLVTSNSREIYQNLNKPDLAVPGYVFPIIWPILFLFMGIASYLIYCSDSKEREKALRLYGINLLLVFVWSVVFFTFQAYAAAFLVIVAFWGVVFTMITMFTQISKVAGWILLPYFIWITYAGYLNLQVVLLN